MGGVNYHLDFFRSIFIPYVSQNGWFPFLEEESVAVTSGAVDNHPNFPPQMNVLFAPPCD